MEARLATPSAPGVVRPTNYARSAMHFTSATVGLVTVAALPTHPGIVRLIAITFATYAWSMEIGRRIHAPLNAALMRLYAHVAHPHERTQVNSGTWYATALVLLAFFATRPATMAALAVLGVADPIAGFVGRRWGRRLLRAGRSLEGTLGFVVSGALAAAFALWLAGGVAPDRVVLLAFLSGIAGAVAELFSTRLDDNLTIPLTVGAVVTAASSLFG